MFAMSLTPGDIMVIVWFAIFIIAAVIEALSMDLDSIWFAAGALIALIVAAIFGGDTVSIVVQVVLFLAVSIATLLLVRPTLVKYLKRHDVPTNADRAIGKTAICIKRITPDEHGEVKIDGKIWTAIATETIENGEKVEVLAIEGVKLAVRKHS